MTVLVAYNDSPQGEAALRAGAAEAVRRDLPLAIFVLTPLEGPPQDDPPLPPDLAHLLDALPAGTPVATVTYREARIDPPVAILDEAERLAASLVVIGSRKRSPVGKFLLGSTTQRVLLDAHAPVLVIKAKH